MILYIYTSARHSNPTSLSRPHHSTHHDTAPRHKNYISHQKQGVVMCDVGCGHKRIGLEHYCLAISSRHVQGIRFYYCSCIYMYHLLFICIFILTHQSFQYISPRNKIYSKPTNKTQDVLHICRSLRSTVYVYRYICRTLISIYMFIAFYSYISRSLISIYVYRSIMVSPVGQTTSYVAQSSTRAAQDEILIAQVKPRICSSSVKSRAMPESQRLARRPQRARSTGASRVERLHLDV